MPCSSGQPSSGCSWTVVRGIVDQFNGPFKELDSLRRRHNDFQYPSFPDAIQWRLPCICARIAHVDSHGLAARITEYRTRAQMTQQQLADAAGIERTVVAKIETGRRRVGALELDALAEALGIRVDWFFNSPAASILAYRSALNPDAATTTIDRWVERLVRDVDFVQELEAAVPALAGGERTIGSLAESERFAGHVRKLMHVSAGEPILNIADAAARVGVLVFSIDLGADAPEAASTIASSCGIALVNGNLKVGRRRLAAAHELGHLLTRDGYRVDWRIDAPEQHTWETRLDQFARALLLPTLTTKRAWTTARRAPTLREAAVKVASAFQVDMSTLARRLLDLDVVGDADAKEIRTVRTTKADIVDLGLVVRDDLSVPSAPAGYQRAVLGLYRSETVTADRALELLAGTFEESDLPQLAPLPEDSVWSLL